MKKYITAIVFVIGVLAAPYNTSAQTSQAPKSPPSEQTLDQPVQTPSEEAKGKRCLFIGHSFFIPVARVFDKQAQKAGVKNHSQQSVFAGGMNGSPQRLWQNQKKRKQIQKILDQGDIELFGMTYFYSSLDDYRKWIDYALQKNPKTDFFIGMPWGQDGPSRSVDGFASISARAQAEFYPEVIEKLRELYPKNRFYWINYGRVAVELKRAHKEKALPMVKQLVSRQGADAIFRDKMGHASPLTMEMASMVWLSVLYQVEPSSYSWRHQGSEPLEAILKRISEQEHSYNR